ncbi:MAG: ATP-binding protein [Clostridia bacterium]|nr:ATP-binding protein [Clostridia bacterium]
MNKEIKEILDSRRLRAERVANHYKQLILSMPKVKKLYQIEIDLTLQKAKAEAFCKPFDTQKLAVAKQNLDKIFLTIGFNRENLAPHYTCPLCEDTGYIEGKECQCVAKIQSELNLKNSQITNFKEFDDIDYTMISTEMLKNLIQKLQKISQTENQKYRLITLCGNAGVGKTFFLQCMANEYLKRSKNVLMDTAFKINNDFLKLHTSKEQKDKISYMDKYLAPDVLIIDDLGSEPTYKNVTKEYFYLLLNQRGLDQKITLISTNLLPQHLSDRYGERCFSRIINKANNLLLKIENDDLRFRKIKHNNQQ